MHLQTIDTKKKQVILNTDKMIGIIQIFEKAAVWFKQTNFFINGKNRTLNIYPFLAEQIDSAGSG